MGWIREMLAPAPLPSLAAFAVDAVPTKVPTQVQGAPTRSGIRQVPSQVRRNITPAKIASALRQADEGDPLALFELLEQMEDRDLHLVSVLGTRKRAVANRPWSLAPASDDARDVDAAAELEDLLRAVPGLTDCWVELMDSVSKGMAAVEIDWTVSNGQVGIAGFERRPQRWFRPDEADPNQWTLLGENGQPEPLTPWRFCIHHSRAKSGFPVQAGLGRVLLWWWLFGSYAVKDWVSYAELYGAPLRTITAPPGASPTDLDEASKALARLGVDAHAVLPHGFAAEFHGAKEKGDPKVYAELLKMVQAGMSKAVLGQTLTTQEGTTGSQALGRVHDDVRQDLMEADAQQLASTFTECVLKPWSAWRFGPDVGVPQLVFDTDPPEDDLAVAEVQDKRAQVFAKAAALGVPVTLAQVREELNIREPQGSEELVRVPTQSPEPGEVDAVDAESETGGASPNSVRAGVAGLPLAADPSGQKNTNAQKRPTQAETLAGDDLGGASPFADSSVPPHLQQVQAALSRYLEGGAPDAWTGLVEGLAAELRAAGSLEAAQTQFDAIVGKLGMGALQEQLQDAMLEGGLIGRVQAEDGAGDTPIADLPAIPPRQAIEYWTTKTPVTRAQFDAMSLDARSKAFTASRFQVLTALETVYEALGDAIANGGTFDEFEDVYNAELKRQGFAPEKPWRIETVFRQGVFTAYSVDRRRSHLRNAANRPYLRYNAMDPGGRTRPEHSVMDDRVYAVDDDVWAIWTPPNGFGCLCWVTSHRAKDVEDKGWGVSTDLPINLGTGQKAMPDRGFEVDPAAEPHELDFSRFRDSWKLALGIG